MVDLSELIGMQLSLLIMGEEDDEEDDWAVLTGIVQEGSDGLILSRPDGPFALRLEWLDPTKPVDPRVKGVLLAGEYGRPHQARGRAREGCPARGRLRAAGPDRRPARERHAEAAPRSWRHQAGEKA